MMHRFFIQFYAALFRFWLWFDLCIARLLLLFKDNNIMFVINIVWILKYVSFSFFLYIFIYFFAFVMFFLFMIKYLNRINISYVLVCFYCIKVENHRLCNLLKHGKFIQNPCLTNTYHIKYNRYKYVVTGIIRC